MTIWMNKNLFFIFLCALAIVVIFLNGLPSYTHFGNSEIVGPIKFLSKQIPVHDGLYSNYVLAYKSRIPFIHLSKNISDLFSISPPHIDHINYFLTAFLVFLAIYFFLTKYFHMGNVWGAVSSLSLLLVNPLRDFYYGYHYKVGTGGSTLGLIAFSLITFLFYLLIARKTILHVLFLLLLYSVHPLNAILYFGFFIFYQLVLFLQNENRAQIVRTILLNAIPLTIILLVSFSNYSVLHENTEKALRLIWLINSPGAYFYSWMNPEKLAQAAVFFCSFFPLLWIGRKRNLFSAQFFTFVFSFSVFAFLLCLLNFVAYEFKWAPLLPLDISRVFALQIPLAFICVIGALFHLWKQENKKGLAAIGLLLFACINSQFMLLPLVVWLILFGKEEKIRTYATVFLPLVILLTLARFEGGAFKWLDLDLQKNKGSPLLAAFFLALALGYPILKRGLQISVLAVLMALLVVGYRYGTHWSKALHSNKESEQSYRELFDFINTRTNPSDIFLTPDSVFAFNYPRNHFITIHYAGYGIYMGQILRLEKESKLIWDFDLNHEFTERFKDDKEDNELKLERHMINTLKRYTPDRLKLIQKAYPAFRYILMMQDDLPFVYSLPLNKIFENKIFVLFELQNHD